MRLFSSGVPVIAILAASSFRAPVRLALGVLHELGLVEQEELPGVGGVLVELEAEHRVPGHDEVGSRELVGDRGAELAAVAPTVST